MSELHDAAQSPGGAAGSPQAGEDGEWVEPLEDFIARVLRLGVVASAAISGLGFLLDLLLPALGRTVGRSPVGYGDILRGVARGNPLALIDLGLIVLVLTPVARVAGAAVAYARVRDRAFTAITLFVLTMLILSFLLGKAGG